MTALISELMLAVGGSFITSLLAKATGVALVALAGTWLMRASRAAVRHVLLAAAFAVLLALPVAALVTPPLRVEVPIAAAAGASAQRVSTLETILLLDPVESPAATSPVARVSSSGVSAARVLLTIWGVGATLLLAPVIVGLWQLRSLRRSGLPWRQGQAIVDRMAGELGVARRVDVLLHESVAGPMTCGVIHPAIVLPVDAPTWTDSNLRRALVHELEHVRRIDWMSQCLARVVCAGYWFHPLVWMAWRRLSLEAERACDDAVLRRAEAADYADQLVVLAERLSAASNTPLLAMASRHDLATRVVAVLDGSQRRGRAGFRLVAFACALAGLVVLTMSPLRIVAASPDPATGGDFGVGQATLNSAGEPRVQPTSKKFEVASIRPCKTEDVIPQQRSGGRGGGAASYSASPGRLNIPCLGMLEIIYLAYAGFGAGPDERLLNNAGSPTNASSIRGGPAWVRSDSEKYAIDAKAEDAADRRQMMGPMLRTLLEERFQLKLHREVEQAPMYALIVARGGLKVQPMKDDECTNDPPRPPGQPPAEKMTCGSLMMAGQMGRRALTFVGTSLSDFARTLSGGMDRYVLDKTGIEGRFILRLEYVQDENTVRMPLGTPIRPDPGPDDPPGVSILTALQEQLGLKLEPTRGPREVLVIDRIERPSSNSGAVAFTSSRGINSR